MRYHQASSVHEGESVRTQIRQTSPAWTLHWMLRIGVSGCFIGHGAFGVITKAEWLRYFAVCGIGPHPAYELMPLIGSLDILVGLCILLYPTRAALFWAILWTVWTALLRPLSGEGVWEFLERAGNYGVPLALLYLADWPPNFKKWFSLATPRLDAEKSTQLLWMLRLTTCFLLGGHGAFGAFMHKHAWGHYLNLLGFRPEAVSTLALIPIVGWFEIALSVAVFVLANPGLLVFVCVWKIFTELFRLGAGEPAWEFIERFGSYAATLALLYLVIETGGCVRRSCCGIFMHGQTGSPWGPGRRPKRSD